VRDRPQSAGAGSAKPGADRALGKPFKPSQLRSAVAELLAARAADRSNAEG
jgi:hypothetical protein